MSGGRASKKTISCADNSSFTIAPLLAAKSVPDLFKRCAEILRDRSLLNCKEVTFYRRSNGSFKVAYTTRNSARPLNPARNAALKRLLRGEVPYLSNGRQQITIPMRSRGRLMGLVRLDLHPRGPTRNSRAPGPLVRAKWLSLQSLICMISSVMECFRLQRKLKRQSIIDPLTRVYNRGYFDRQSRIEVLRAKRYSKKITFILVDLDNLKDINDAYGHLEGDNVLHAIGRLLKKNCRQIDLVCRYGGDEFVIVLLETGRRDALKKAEALRKKIEKSNFRSAQHRERIPVSTSFGIAALEGRIRDRAQLFHAADRALYRAKKNGKNRCCCHT